MSSSLFPGQVEPTHPTYRLATFADDAAGGEGRHLDVGFELHFFFWVKEVFLFQLPKYSPLGLERAQKGHRGGGQHPGGGLQAMMCQCLAAPKLWSQAEKPPWHFGDQRDAVTLPLPMSPSQPPTLWPAHLELSLRGPRDDHHALAGIWTFCRGDLQRDGEGV